MRRQLLAATALTTTILFLVPGAMAQPAPYNWSGFYAGFSLGAAKGNTSFELSTSSPPATGDVPVLGGSGTITLGYNAQSNSFVYGIAADGSLLSVIGTGSAAGGTASSALDRLFTLRGRLGIANGSMLYFATAGVAAGHETFTTVVGSLGLTPAMGDGYVFGPTYGVGVEVALNDKVSLTAEGLVTNLGPLTASGDTGKGGGAYDATATTTSVSVRGGVNFHF
jgi:outer membrane immunogenic protein